MGLARIKGSISEWQPYAYEGDEKFILRRTNGDIVATVGAKEDVETEKDEGLFRFDPKSRCFVPQKGRGPRSAAAKSMKEFKK